MGRLFWKFFFFIWLAQLTAVAAISTVFWLERQRDFARWQLQQERGEMTGQAWQPPPGAPVPGGAGEHRLAPRPDRPPPEFGRLRPRQPPVPWVPLLATLGASLIFAALLAWYFAKPIRHLRRAFAAAATGDLEQRLGEAMGKRRDELADLGRDFDRMSAQLQSLLNGQRRLLHDVSHELRSPLARLQAAVGLLRQRPENWAAACERIERECGRMDQLVGELLRLARLEAAGQDEFADDILLESLLGELAADAAFEAQASGRRVDLDCPSGLRLRGNAELLHRALENVVRNALRFAPEGSQVSIVAGQEAQMLHIRVCDSGPGIPETHLEEVFEPFRRAHAASGDGHGLGLAIARRIVAAHGGLIQARNRPEGGLCVEISLPL